MKLHDSSLTHAIGQRVVIKQNDIAGFSGLTGAIVKVTGPFVTVLLDPYKDRYYNPTNKTTFTHRVAFGRRSVQTPS